MRSIKPEGQGVAIAGIAGPDLVPDGATEEKDSTTSKRKDSFSHIIIAVNHKFATISSCPVSVHIKNSSDFAVVRGLKGIPVLVLVVASTSMWRVARTHDSWRDINHT